MQMIQYIKKCIEPGNIQSSDINYLLRSVIVDIVAVPSPINWNNWI